MKFEEYIQERLHQWDISLIEGETVIDANTNEIITFYKSDESAAIERIAEIDRLYLNSFEGQYILHKKLEQDDWIVYKTIKIDAYDPHNGSLLVKHVGKNFKEHKHKSLFFRRGLFKSVTKDEIIQLKGWHLPASDGYRPKDLYIFKNEIGRIKIGQAINVNQRIEAITMQSGIDIAILNIIKERASFECVLHGIFKNKRFKGEWFNLSSKETKWLQQLTEDNIDYEVEGFISQLKITGLQGALAL